MARLPNNVKSSLYKYDYFRNISIFASPFNNPGNKKNFFFRNSQIWKYGQFIEITTLRPSFPTWSQNVSAWKAKMPRNAPATDAEL